MRTKACFFNDTAPTEIYALSLHDALPIYRYFGDLLVSADPALEAALAASAAAGLPAINVSPVQGKLLHLLARDRKSTRLNSSHANNSYAVFCLKKTNTHDA